MIKQALLPILAVMALSVPAMAQDSGGVSLAPGVHGGPKGLARLLPFVPQPFVTAHDLQNGMTAADHQAANQNAITQLRGDPGFLSGFSMGTPLAASRCCTGFTPRTAANSDATGGRLAARSP